LNGIFSGATFPEMYLFDPPRWRPFGGGGTPRSWGYGGISPHHCNTPALPCVSRKVQAVIERFRKKSDPAVDNPGISFITLLKIKKKSQP
jgi:hypothetical protein